MMIQDRASQLQVFRITRGFTLAILSDKSHSSELFRGGFLSAASTHAAIRMTGLRSSQPTRPAAVCQRANSDMQCYCGYAGSHVQNGWDTFVVDLVVACTMK